MEMPKSDLAITSRELPLSTQPLVAGEILTAYLTPMWINHDYHTRPDLYNDGIITSLSSTT